MKKISKRIYLAIISFVLIAAMALTFCSCGKKENKKTDTDSVSSTTVKTTTLGNGNTKFDFIVTDTETGEVANFVIKTDKKTVGEALMEQKLIEGEDSEYGLYVKKVNGIKADYDKDGYYWGFYVNGDIASSGVNSTDVVSGSTYEFKKEKA